MKLIVILEEDLVQKLRILKILCEKARQLHIMVQKLYWTYSWKKDKLSLNNKTLESKKLHYEAKSLKNGDCIKFEIQKTNTT